MSRKFITTLCCVLLAIGTTYASNIPNREFTTSLVETFYKNMYLIQTAQEKHVIANMLIQSGILTGALLNGHLSDHPIGILENNPHYKEIVRDCLQWGSTVTASKELLKKFNKEACQNGILDLSVKKNTKNSAEFIITVRDVHQGLCKEVDIVDFSTVTVINLCSNKLTEIPVPFFKLFPNAQKYILTSNPIAHLDTTYMPYGLVIDATHTDLVSISNTRLDRNGNTALNSKHLTFLVAHTPLAQDRLTLEILKNDCNRPAKNCLQKCFEYVWNIKEKSAQKESHIVHEQFVTTNCSAKTQPHQQ